MGSEEDKNTVTYSDCIADNDSAGKRGHDKPESVYNPSRRSCHGIDVVPTRFLSDVEAPGLVPDGNLN